jgi:hypothetical protein
MKILIACKHFFISFNTFKQKEYSLYCWKIRNNNYDGISIAMAKQWG